MAIQKYFYYVVILAGLLGIGLFTGNLLLASAQEPQVTGTPSASPEASPTHTADVDPTMAASIAATALAEHDVIETNQDWEPLIQTFEGVEMVLIPAGCFLMGSSRAGLNERPEQEFCLDRHYWIDRTEVTSGQFTQVGGHAANPDVSEGDNYPRVEITWFEARDYCELRDARLPTEAEWEYAAGGPDGLVFPWGDDFVAENIVYVGTAKGHTAEVSSRPDGQSWVGAMDMAGNVWEWVNSMYQPYPYMADDGRELDNNSTDVERVVRGGSWSNGEGYDVRTTFRFMHDPSTHAKNLGVRCARSYER